MEPHLHCVNSFSLLLIFLNFSPECAENWSTGATESEVWIGNFNVKAWKTTEYKLHKIWCSLKFFKISGKWAQPWAWKYFTHFVWRSTDTSHQLRESLTKCKYKTFSTTKSSNDVLFFLPSWCCSSILKEIVIIVDLLILNLLFSQDLSNG